MRALKLGAALHSSYVYSYCMGNAACAWPTTTAWNGGNELAR